jgi:hypothetical protein
MRGLWRNFVTILITGVWMAGGPIMAQSTPVKNIVLVHGAFADGSSWSKVIHLLQSEASM